MKKNSTKKRTAPKQKANPYEVAAQRVAVILADPTTPKYLWDVLTDMLCDLPSQTGVTTWDPDVARILLTKAFPIAEAQGLRQMNHCPLEEGGIQ